jgi:hypothetical protein
MILIMHELQFILLIGILIQNFNIVDLTNFLEKNKKTLHLDCSNHIKDDIIENHEQKQKVKRSEKPRFYGPNKLLS